MANRIRVVATGEQYVFTDFEQKMIDVFDAQYEKYVQHSQWADDMDTPVESRNLWGELANMDYFELRGMYHMLQQVISDCPIYAELVYSKWAE